MRRLKLAALGMLLLVGAMAWMATPTPPARAADHGDAPNVDSDSGADIADVYLFLDPNNNERVILIGTIHGFITPGEGQNFGTFDEHILYRFLIENTGDAKPDAMIDVAFSARTAGNAPQTALVRLPNKKTFSAPTTPPNLTSQPTTQAITTNAENDVRFFAGIVDDPFFFDIPGFQRFVGSVLAGNPNPTLLQRGRDTFAGYNIMGIALDMPKSLIRGDPSNNVVGVELLTMRRTETQTKTGETKGTGKFRQKDRMGNAGVNVALIPFGRKSAFNGGTPIDDSKGKFQQDILNTLTALGTDDAHKKIFTDLVVARGDYLRLDLTIPNSGTGGGDNPEASYPNGRRLKDDIIDITLSLVANASPVKDAATGKYPLGDGTDASDIPPQSQFPFLALPQQPRDAGVIDDNTRN